MSERYAAVVIGGGVMGLAALEALSRRTREPIALVERFAVGHPHGSSHGAARIARSTYADPLYARLMRRAELEDWARLERDADERLLHRSPGVFFGADAGPIDAYRDAVRSAGLGDDLVEELCPTEARRRHPALRFERCAYVLDDRTCAVVAAERTVRALARLAAARGARIFTHTAVLALEVGGGGCRIVTAAGVLVAERVIVAAGAWTSRLVPGLADRLTVLRQTVAYLRPASDAEGFRLGRVPLWVEIGSETSGLHYALPDLDAGLLKIARHRLDGAADDPDAGCDADGAEVARLRDRAARELAIAVGDVARAETCLYTCTSDEDFILDRLPGEPRVIVGAGFSGHGFKFAPLVGRILAELALDGQSSVPEFAAEHRRFAIAPRTPATGASS